MFTDLNSEIFAWIRGGFFILAIYHLLIYFQNGKKLYLYYCFYLLTFFAFFASRLFQNINNDTILGYFSVPMFFLTSASFYALTRTILETKSRIPKWDYYFKIATVVSIGVAFMFFCFAIGFRVRVFFNFCKVNRPISLFIFNYFIFCSFKNKIKICNIF